MLLEVLPIVDTHIVHPTGLCEDMHALACTVLAQARPMMWLDDGLWCCGKYTFLLGKILLQSVKTNTTHTLPHGPQ